MRARPNLDDSRALLARARRHFAEFNALLFPHGGLGLWQTKERRDDQTGEFFYRLHMDRQRLIEAKAIISDAATNIISALDHVAAAIAKANGEGRSRSLYFPLGLTDGKFKKALAKAAPMLGSRMTAVLETARAKHRHEVHHVEAVKEISNTGKHWELMVATGSAHGVALHVPGSEQRIFQVPGNAFAVANAFEFHRSGVRLPSVPLNIVIGLTINGLNDELPKSPDVIFECSFRFVEGVITAVDEATR